MNAQMLNLSTAETNRCRATLCLLHLLMHAKDKTVFEPLSAQDAKRGVQMNVFDDMAPSGSPSFRELVRSS